jgi:hypothetical protein
MTAGCGFLWIGLAYAAILFIGVGVGAFVVLRGSR